MTLNKFKTFLYLLIFSLTLWAASDVITLTIVVNDNPIDHCALLDVQDSVVVDHTPLNIKCLVRDAGVTDKPGPSPLLSAELGFNINNSSPYKSGWEWFPATYLSEDDHGEIYSITLPVEEIPESGLFYLLSRFALPDSQYVYGAYNKNADIGGKWDGNTFTAPLIYFIRQTATEDIPESFALHAPYPNPFNPGTTINFDIAEETQLYLNVFDLNGKKVRELWNGNCNLGYYSQYIDMSGFSSGIYIVQMLTPNYRNVHKILLVK